jgi:hypothetical protein
MTIQINKSAYIRVTAGHRPPIMDDREWAVLLLKYPKKYIYDAKYN